MRYFSAFSGIGGFELGIQAAYENNNKQVAEILKKRPGRDRNTLLRKAVLRGGSAAPLCVGYSEIDRYAKEIYSNHFPAHHNYGDITKIIADELPDFDLFVGGFPCQPFSVAGLRRGFLDPRGTLFGEIVRIVAAKRPALLLLENVKGLLSHGAGQTFSTILWTLDELGYDLQWQVLNSKDHGVPQNRERVIIVGHLRGKSRPEVFPFPYDADVPPRAPQSEAGRAQAEVSHTLRGSSVKADQVFVVDASYPSRLRKYSKYTPTVRNYGSGGNKMPLMGGIRRLTPVECERLQGFPDNWTEGISDTQRYKTLGNAVTVNVIRDVAERMLA